MTKKHPQDMAFADDIASSGDKIVPFLTNKIRIGRNENIQQKIIYIFERMVSRHHYRLKDNAGLVGFLQDVISSMKDAFYKGKSQHSLQVITGDK